MTTVLLRTVHASGEHYTPVPEVVDYLANVLVLEYAHLEALAVREARRNKTAVEPIALVLTTTECQQRGLVKPLGDKLGTAWVVRRRGEYVMAWRHAGAHQIGTSRLWHVTKTLRLIFWRQVRASLRKLRLVANGRRIEFIVPHYPSGIEDGPRFRKEPRRTVRTAKTAWHKVGLHMDATAASDPDIIQIHCDDGNLDLHRPEFVAYTETHLGADLAFKGHMGALGTHGRRWIDGIYTRGPGIERVETHRVTAVPRPIGGPQGGYDHVTVAATHRVHPAKEHAA